VTKNIYIYIQYEFVKGFFFGGEGENALVESAPTMVP
jgi:hypothetical protein